MQHKIKYHYNSIIQMHLNHNFTVVFVGKLKLYKLCNTSDDHSNDNLFTYNIHKLEPHS